MRGFTQDDAHIFCLPEQVEEEIISVLDLTEAILSRFGFDRYCSDGSAKLGKERLCFRLPLSGYNIVLEILKD